MFVTDNTFTNDEFLQKLKELGQELANRVSDIVPGVKVNVTPYYTPTGSLVGYDVIIDRNNRWLVSHIKNTGRVGVMRVYG